MIFTHVLAIHLRFTPSIILPHHLLPPFFRTISAGFILLFSYMNTKYIYHIHTLSHFPYVHSSLMVSTSRKDLFYPTVLHFFKIYIDSPGGFCLGTSDLYISCFNQINPPRHNLVFLYHHASITFNSYSAIHYIIFIYRWIFQYFSFSKIFFPIPAS
jgi:hypothetical protein